MRAPGRDLSISGRLLSTKWTQSWSAGVEEPAIAMLNGKEERMVAMSLHAPADSSGKAAKHAGYRID